MVLLRVLRQAGVNSKREAPHPPSFLLSFEMSFLRNLNLEQKAGNNLNLMNLDVIRGTKSNVEDNLEAKEE